MPTALPVSSEKRDARKLSKQELQERRAQVIALYQEGVPVMQITQRCAMSWSGVNAAINLFKKGGEDALLPRSRGRKQGTGRLLSKEQEVEICQLMFMRRPWYYKLKDSLWSLDTVMQLIDKKLDIEISERGLGNYLKRWGIIQSTHKDRPYDRCVKEVRIFLDHNYEAILNRAHLENAEIIWMNSIVKLDKILWTKINTDDENSKNTNDKQKSLVSVVNNQGKLSWIIINGLFNPEKQIKFVKNMLTEKGKKLYLIRCDGRVFSNWDCLHWMNESNNVIAFPAISIPEKKS
jgi:transposase